MRKFILAGFLTLCGMAGAATLPEILSPSPQALSTACDQGYRIESMPRTSQAEKEAYQAAYNEIAAGKSLRDTRSAADANKADAMTKLSALTSPLDLQFPSGSVYNICGARAEKLAEKPKVETLKAYTLVTVFGDAKERKDAESWNAIFAMLDANGQEVKRVQALPVSMKGDLNYWKPSCTSSFGCKWVGRNVYYFELGSIDPKVVSVKLMFTRGRGVEQRVYTSDDLSKTYITDPKAP